MASAHQAPAGNVTPFTRDGREVFCIHIDAASRVGGLSPRQASR
jgi:hypothetical protein